VAEARKLSELAHEELLAMFGEEDTRAIEEYIRNRVSRPERPPIPLGGRRLRKDTRPHTWRTPQESRRHQSQVPENLLRGGVTLDNAPAL